MEILLFFLGLVLGGLVSWLITHVYYRIATKEQDAVYKKLSKKLQTWILADTRKHLSVADLNALLEQKTIDPDSDYPFPYKACPKCGSANVYRTTDVEGECEAGDNGEPFWTPIYFKALACDDCGWKLSEATDRPKQRH